MCSLCECRLDSGWKTGWGLGGLLAPESSPYQGQSEFTLQPKPVWSPPWLQLRGLRSQQTDVKLTLVGSRCFFLKTWSGSHNAGLSLLEFTVLRRQGSNSRREGGGDKWPVVPPTERWRQVGQEEFKVILSSHVNLGHPVLLETLGREGAFINGQKVEWAVFNSGWLPRCAWKSHTSLPWGGASWSKPSKRTFCHVWGHM